jgi:hypothetical protein
MLARKVAIACEHRRVLARQKTTQLAPVLAFNWALSFFFPQPVRIADVDPRIIFR